MVLLEIKKQRIFIFRRHAKANICIYSYYLSESLMEKEHYSSSRKEEENCQIMAFNYYKLTTILEGTPS